MNLIKLISILIPTYNEAKNIGSLLRRIFAALSTLDIPYEIIIVDDASNDGTAEIAQELLQSRGRVINRVAQTKGLSLSILEGIRLAKGDIIIVMDGDESHPPELIPSFIKYVKEGYDLIVASRYVKGGVTQGFPFVRNLISRFSCFLGNLVTRIKDNTSGFFCVRKDALDGVNLIPCGFKIGLEIFVKAKIKTYKEIPYIFINRQRGESKLNAKTAILFIFHILSILRYKILKNLKMRALNLFDSLIVSYIYFYLCLFITDFSFLFLPLHKKLGFPFERVSNINGPTIGLIFLLLFRYISDRKSFFHNKLARKLSMLTRVNERKTVFCAMAFMFIVFSVLSVARHFALSSGTSDLGIFDQALWNTIHGDLLFSSLKGNINLLGDHFEPILLLIAPLYKIWPHAVVLLILQSLLMTIALPPLYLIAKETVKNRLLIFVFIISYILSKPLRGVAFSDFHPEAFMVPLLFWAYYFLMKGKNIFLFISVFLLLLCKEDAAFLVSGLGIFAWAIQRKQTVGITLTLLGIVAWLLETQIIIPYLNPLGQYPYMDRLPFGLTYMENIKTIYKNPLSILSLLSNKEKLEYCVKLLAPLGFLPLISPPHYILIAIPLIKNMLASQVKFSGFYNITSHYTASIVPFVYIAAMYGAAKLIKLMEKLKTQHQRISPIIGTYIMLGSLFFYGKTDGYKLQKYLNTIRSARTYERLSYLKKIPNDVSVSTNFNLVPHISHRKYIFEWNPKSETSFLAEYIAIDFDLLEYLTESDKLKINFYLQEIKKKGYKKFFVSEDERFVIYNKD